jgi:hypothetical protein
MAELPPVSRHRIGQAGFTLLGTALVLGLVTTLLHARQEVFYIPAYGVGIAVGAFVLAAMGLGLSWRSSRFGLATFTMLAVVLGVVGVLAILSIGILLLAVSLALFLVLGKLPRGAHRTAAAAGGVLLGLGVPPIALMSFLPPLVDCRDGSSGENMFLGFESNSGGGSSSVSADGRRASGRAHGDTFEYAYECRDGKLVRFDFRRR